jgi:hypothetical protein
MHGPLNVKFSIDFSISECSINSAFERARTVMRTISRGLLLENFAGIGSRGYAEQSGLQLPCLSNSLGRSTAELTDVECVWNLMAHGDAQEGKCRGNWRMEWVDSTLTLPRNVVYAALLPPMRTPRLPAVDWTDAPTDLNGLVRFGERRNLVSAHVPSHFKRTIIHNAQPLTMYKSQGFYNWRSVSRCVFLPSPCMGSWPYIFLSWLLHGCLRAFLSTRRWALSFIKFLIFVSIYQSPTNLYGTVVRYKDVYTVHLSLVIRLFGLRLLWFNAPCEFTPLNLRSLTFCFNAVWLAAFCFANPLFLMGM